GRRTKNVSGVASPRELVADADGAGAATSPTSIGPRRRHPAAFSSRLHRRRRVVAQSQRALSLPSEVACNVKVQEFVVTRIDDVILDLVGDDRYTAQITRDSLPIARIDEVRQRERQSAILDVLYC